MLHYPHCEKVIYSIGVIKSFEDDNYNFNHSCLSESSSSGGPLLNFSNYKVIGINKGGKKTENMNVGTLIKAQIDEFNKKEKNTGDDYKEKKEINNLTKEKDDTIGDMTIIYQNKK